MFGQKKTPILTGIRGGLKDIRIPEKHSSDLMSHLNPEKPIGLVNIGNLFLKKCHRTLCKSMKLLFQFFLIEGLFRHFGILVRLHQFSMKEIKQTLLAIDR